MRPCFLKISRSAILADDWRWMLLWQKDGMRSGVDSLHLLFSLLPPHGMLTTGSGLSVSPRPAPAIFSQIQGLQPAPRKVVDRMAQLK